MTVDIASLREKYLAERDKRLRPDGASQYVRLADEFDIGDPFTPMTEREPLTDHTTVVCVGGGFSGLVVGARLKEAGIEDVRIIDKAGDFGGTWYWNRYPGAQCDTTSYIYLPLLEETGHMPTEKYAHGPEILEHCQRIGKQYDLYEQALFHTEVTDLRWDEDQSRWIIRTNRGDRLTAQFVVMGIGPLHVPKLPAIPGIGEFRGHSFHTNRWDYDYTGASLEKLADKRVAIIGTGATSVQAVPRLAQACGELFVIQRTPSSVDARDNRPTDPEWFAEMATPGWQRRLLANFADVLGGVAEQDMIRDGWTEMSRKIRAEMVALPAKERTMATRMELAERADYEKMDQIRSRVDTIVADHDTAQHLKAWYRRLCKRPCFHDEYLQSFNNPNTHLVDTDGKGVQRITADGVVAGGREHKVDCVIYASGFEVNTDFTRRSGYEVTGRGGVTLTDHWADGMRTLHGMHTHGFPNAFVVQPTQGANLIANIPSNIVDSAATIAAVVGLAVRDGHREVEVTAEAQDAWAELLSTAPASTLGGPDCTPGYYNNEGQDRGPAAQLLVGYPQGPSAFFAYIEKWRTAGTFEGLEFR
ncbi:flavin-containing monooxygenase [Kutzneria sp. CA-103260]|uniref:flavin-containing monooxygenase n=1 Tax=Kutzneria sp. CA-103260 TaxID=2802641 RepID=UPI001BA8A846|nr:NAD(P)/FAD-dependent oxidoreductase [Kutzneria sp. CA-103260]QUQ62375.1 NAD(P)/FAD-dependent oxidoreductase [Kutzneria sp. CA-103260]